MKKQHKSSKDRNSIVKLLTKLINHYYSFSMDFVYNIVYNCGILVCVYIKEEINVLKTIARQMYETRNIDRTR